MYEAVLIKPEYLRKRGKKSVACTFSGLKYTTDEYEVLFKAKKLAYFEFTSFIHTHPIVCHEVLYKYSQTPCQDIGDPQKYSEQVYLQLSFVDV